MSDDDDTATADDDNGESRYQAFLATGRAKHNARIAANVELTRRIDAARGLIAHPVDALWTTPRRADKRRSRVESEDDGIYARSLKTYPGAG